METDRSFVVVVPTLGVRDDYLRESLRAVREAGTAHVVIVAPSTFDASRLIEEGLADEKIDELRPGLSAAINKGFAAHPQADYVGWIGDDDLLAPGSIDRARDALASDPEASAVFGACEYIDADGRRIGINRSGPWAVPLLRFGPDLIPQPGSFFRGASVRQIGRLREDLRFAMDLDYFIRLRSVGKLRYLSATQAAFRFHAESLSVGSTRRETLREATYVRVSHLPPAMRYWAPLWEAPSRWLTLSVTRALYARVKRATAKQA